MRLGATSSELSSRAPVLDRIDHVQHLAHTTKCNNRIRVLPILTQSCCHATMWTRREEVQGAGQQGSGVPRHSRLVVITVAGRQVVSRRLIDGCGSCCRCCCMPLGRSCALAWAHSHSVPVLAAQVSAVVTAFTRTHGSTWYRTPARTTDLAHPILMIHAHMAIWHDCRYASRR